MVNVTTWYRVIADYEDFLDNVVLYSEIDVTDPPSYPCFIEFFNRGGEITYEYTEVADFEGVTKTKYVDEDPEYSVLLDVAREMMFTNSRIEDSTKGI